MATPSKKVTDVFGYSRGIWLGVVGAISGWWTLQVSSRPSCLFTPYSELASYNSYAMDSSLVAFNKRGGRRGEGVVLLCSCPYAAVWSDGLLGSSGGALLVAVMKYVGDAGVGVMMSMRLCPRRY